MIQLISQIITTACKRRPFAHFSLAFLATILLMLNSMAPGSDSVLKNGAQPEQERSVSTAAAQGQKDLPLLEVGKPVERELAGGQSHSYQITLTAGQYFHAVVEQRGIDVVVLLFGPDARQLLEVDSPNGTEGPEPVRWIVEKAGAYLIEVRSLEKEAKAGRYEVQVSELRTATAADRDLIEKELDLRRADELNSEVMKLVRAGQYDKALPPAERALAIREKILGPNHPDFADSLINLAVIYDYKGDYAKAEQLYQRTLAIREKALGPDHHAVANSLNNLALLYHRKSDYTRAEPLYQRALVIREKALGPDHPLVANSLNNLAGLHDNKGAYETLHQRALAIREKRLGPDHPDVVQSLNNLAFLYDDNGDYAKAIAQAARASAVMERNLLLNLVSGSERQKLAYLANYSAKFDSYVALHIQSAPNDPMACNLAVNSVLRRKGRVLDAMTDSLAALRRRASPQDQLLLDQLQETNARLARLVLDGPQKKTPAEYQQQIKTLEEQKEKLEAEISHNSAEFRAQAQPIALENIQAAIPPGAVLVEFALYRPHDAKTRRSGPARYAAYVMAHDGQPRYVDLGEAEGIDRAVDSLRQALRDPKREDVSRLSRAVDEKVMQPVRPLLGEARKVLISPDGALNLIPFAALVDERNKHLIERYSITYLTSGRDLLRLQVPRQSRSEPLVVANPNFGIVTSLGQPADQKSGRLQPDDQSSVQGDFSRMFFTVLPGTAGEAKTLKSLLPRATVLTEDQATESALKQARGPNILHIATHGFFLEDMEQKFDNTRGGSWFGEGMATVSELRSGAWAARIENPLLRSGLALAGFNRRRSGDDDGALTAMEAAGLDLWGTKLVVLSACDTGVGEVKNGEGVYGLRRALVLAGSESQVMSLWPVSDKHTRDLMIAYYRALLRGEGRGEALRSAQLKMLRSEDQRHPYYWASFIQSGEWANLAGKR